MAEIVRQPRGPAQEADRPVSTLSLGSANQHWYPGPTIVTIQGHNGSPVLFPFSKFAPSAKME